MWFTEISQPRTQRSLRTFVSNVTERGMTVNIETWGGSEFEGARVAWLAWPAEFDGKMIRAGDSIFDKGQAASEEPWYQGSFSKEPKVFCALNYMDFPESRDTNLRMLAMHEWATKDRLRWQGGTWHDTPMHKLGICWIAVE